MPLPIVAIVGRPNVGKSSIFNWLARRRISIVEPTAGVTRDRITTTLEFDNFACDLVDTGGMGIQDVDDLTEDVEKQIQFALNSATVVIFVVDIRDGVVVLDEIVARRLRVVNKPVIFVANKADDPKFDIHKADLFRLGYGEPILVSAEQKLGREELLDAISQHLPTDSGTQVLGDVALKLAIVGRRNVGKSTFINSLAQDERCIVSEVAGTTRDSIDVRFERDGMSFLAIDTAGVRKKKSLANDIEFYSLHRAERSIRRADIVMHFFDPRLRISRVDKQLAQYILENDKPAIFVVNKWDLAKATIPTERWTDYLRTTFPMLDYVPIAYITAQKGKNVYRVLNLAQQLFKQDGRRAKTGELNRVIRDAMLAQTPPMRQNRIPKVYYVNQVDVHPPTIVLVANEPDLFDPPYVRYLAKAVRTNFNFGEVPIKLIIKSKSEAAGRGKGSEIEPTAEVPALAQEPIVEEKPAPKRKKPKPKSGTWDL